MSICATCYKSQEKEIEEKEEFGVNQANWAYERIIGKFLVYDFEFYHFLQELLREKIVWSWEFNPWPPNRQTLLGGKGGVTNHRIMPPVW